MSGRPAPTDCNALLGTDLDDVLEGFAVSPEEHVVDSANETTAAARILAVLATARDRDLISDRFVVRLELDSDGKTRPRNRYVGQPRRGTPSYAHLDDQDHGEALRCIEEGMRGLSHCRSQAVRSLPKAQRDDVRSSAVECLRRAQRWLDEIIERNTLKPRRPP